VAVWWHEVARRPAPIARADVIHVLLLGFVGYYLSSYLDFLGLQYVSAGLERIILYLNPTIVLLISALVLKKPVAPRQWLAVALAYAGVALVFLHDASFGGQRALLGSALVFACAVTYACYLILSGEIVHRVGSIRLVAYASTSSAFFCILQALLRHPLGMVSQPAEVYWLSLLNASLCTFVPMLLIMVAVRRVGSGFAAQAGLLGPVATVFLGWYFLGEPVGMLQLAGVAIVLASMALLVTAARPAR
jgi:drug/metabolite transporter (DMT)-like permease